MPELLHHQLSFEVIGAAMEVHRVLGPGFLESVYQKGMEVELRTRQISFEAQRRIPLEYKGQLLGEHVLDLVVDDKIVVELKAVREITDQHQAQTISYLKASGLQIGLLINFARASLEQKRILLKDALLPPNPLNPLNPL
jgi:GxxExxY protein